MNWRECRISSRQGVREEPLFPQFFQAVTVAFDVNRRTMMEDPIQHRCSDHMVTEDLPPLSVGLARGEDRWFENIIEGL